MKQFLDHFESLPALSAGDVIVLGALLTILVICFVLGFVALSMMAQAISEMGNTIAKHKGRKNG